MLWRDRGVLALLLVLGGLLSWSLVSGIAADRARVDALAAVARHEREALAAEKATVERIAAGEEAASPWAGSATSLERQPCLPAPPLYGLSGGQADLQPWAASVSLWKRVDNLFRSHALESPLALAGGRFDAGLLVIVVLPLLLIVLGFDALGADAVSGRAQLLRVQGAGLWQLLCARLGVRAAIALAALLAIGLAGAAGGLDPARLAQWLAIAAAYLAAWGAAIACVAARWRQPAAAAAILVGAWIVVVLLLPAGIALAARLAYPIPPRETLAMELREAEVEAGRRAHDLLGGYVSDHPELSAAAESPDAWMYRYFVVQREIERLTAPVLADFEARREAQRRLGARLAWLSPAALAHHGLLGAAGSGAERQTAFEAQARAFLARWIDTFSAHMFGAKRLAPSDYDALPEFEFVEPPGAAASAASRFAFLGGIAVLLAAFARLSARERPERADRGERRGATSLALS